MLISRIDLVDEQPSKQKGLKVLAVCSIILKLLVIKVLILISSKKKNFKWWIKWGVSVKGVCTNTENDRLRKRWKTCMFSKYKKPEINSITGEYLSLGNAKYSDNIF